MKIITSVTSKIGHTKPTPTFAHLFKFFRIKSNFNTISHFANTLAEEGFAYSDSLFSHWQRGTRTPTNRTLILTLIKVFTKTGAIKYENQANLLLRSAKKGRLELKEKESLPHLKSKNYPFSWEIKLEKFIIADASRQKIKKSHNNIFRFNFILSSENYFYFDKASKKDSVSKAGFLRQLIEDHKNSNSNI